MDDFLDLERVVAPALRKAAREDFFFFGDEERRGIPCQPV
jgi:hypothetical protein